MNWISVKDRLPEENERAIVFAPTNINAPIDGDRFINSRWVRYGYKVTHWMPIPEPPEEKRNDIQ